MLDSFHSQNSLLMDKKGHRNAYKTANNVTQKTCLLCDKSDYEWTARDKNENNPE
jgi:hypothetical protein